MKKRIILFIIIVLIIIGIVFGIKNVNNSKINYEIERINNYNYVQFYENGKYGVLSKEGNQVIPAEYKNVVIPNPEKGVFICYDENENTKIFDAERNEILTNYNNVEPIKLKNVASVLCYEKSVLIYEKDGLYGLIDYNGKKITKNIYDSIENLQLTEGKLLVSKNSKYGVINIKGKVLVKTDYDNIKTDGYYDDNSKYIKAGFIVSNTTNDGYKYGYIDYKGKKILDAKNNEVIRIEELEDLYLIISENGKYGLYKESKEKIKPEYQSIEYDDDSHLLLLQKNKNYGMANLDGKMKIQIKYTNMDLRGIYIYASNEYENDVYDYNGNKIEINFNKSIYETENENYRISTIVNNNITYYGIENEQGSTLINESYSYIEYTFKDYFIAKNQKGKMGLINANGGILIDFKYSFIQKLKGKDILQMINEKNNETYIYSNNLKVICKIKDASIDNQDDYIKVYNKKTEKYFDNSGNEISKDNDLINNTKSKLLPNTIGDYIKIQYSLDSAYYVKK